MASKKPRKTLKTKHEKLQRKMALNEYPPLIRELLEKHEGNMLSASRAVGRATGYWLNRMAMNPSQFNQKAREIVTRAIAGDAIQPFARGPGVPGTAVIISKTDRFEQLYNIGQTMGGEWVFKRRAGPDWVGIVKMPGNELQAFLALCRAKAAEIYIT